MLLGFENDEDFRASHKEWVEEALKNPQSGWEKPFSQNIAIGSEDFVNTIARKLGVSDKQLKQRSVTTSEYVSVREPEVFYSVSDST